jgi:hypothetical protein
VAKSFTAQIDAWVAKTEERIEAVIKTSTIDVIENMQYVISRQPNPRPGVGMAVDTQFLRGSLETNFTGPIAANQSNPYEGIGEAPDWDRNAFLAIVSQYKLGKTIYASYGAEYAAIVHYSQGRLFRDTAVQNWQSIVRRNAVALRSSTTAIAA